MIRLIRTAAARPGTRRMDKENTQRRDGWRDIKTLITALTEFEHNEDAEAERVA